MKLLSVLLISLFTMSASPTSQNFYSFSAKTLEGKPTDFSQYKGKKVLVVNVASECGYTPQYADLEKLSKDYESKLVVLGFPCNQFGGQEPGSAAEIKTFCQKNYGVTFPVFEKVDVKGENAHPLYKWLADKNQNGAVGQEPDWNFCKYLIDEQGSVVAFYPSKVKPLDAELIGAIEK